MVTRRVFSNYRRDDTGGHAGRLYDRLVERFGIGVHARNELGETALHVAARSHEGRRQPAIARALLAAGVEVNARNKKGETALMLIEGPDRARVDDFVQVLLEGGAS